MVQSHQRCPTLFQVAEVVVSTRRSDDPADNVNIQFVRRAEL